MRAPDVLAYLTSTLEAIADPPPFYRGKVRDVFLKPGRSGPDELFLVASDRVSAFDVVLGTIPLKGTFLTEQATFWLDKASAVVPTHLIERVDPQVMRCRRAAAVPVELVVRGHLAGSLMREPVEIRGAAYGLRIDPSIASYAPFPAPVVTPTTKEAVGTHDEPSSLADLVKTGRVTQKHLDRCVEVALALFAMGRAHADAQGLILVDTKSEFGILHGEVILIDELHTADSSRFWLKSTYAERIAAAQPPDMLDKERLRRWLLGQGFSGHGTPPALSDDIRLDLSSHYWTLTEQVLGRPFVPPPPGAARARVTGLLRAALAA